MVHVAFIHEYDDEIRLLQEQKREYAALRDDFSKLDYFIETIDMNNMFEAAEEELAPMMEGVGEALGSIGKKIMGIIKRVKKFISDTISKFTKAFHGKEKDLKEVEKLVKKDPDKAALKVRNLIADGKLTVNDFSDLAKYYQQIDQVLKEMDRNINDPGKLHKMIKKAENTYREHETAFKAASVGTATAVSVVKLIQMFKKNNKVADEKIEDAQSKYAKTAADIQMELDTLNRADVRNNAQQYRTRASVLAHAAASEERVTQSYVKGWTNVKTRMFDMLDSALRLVHAGNANAYNQVVDRKTAAHNSAMDTANRYGRDITHMKVVNTPDTTKVSRDIDNGRTERSTVHANRRTNRGNGLTDWDI